ncbi:MAG: hypothetical protein LBU27_02990 [Candidatus Peribacteria bacterium]|nr:hypothetical protein [Candidatus Peribacteria bacterium]
MKHQEKINALIEQRNISQALVNTAETGGNGIRYTDEDDGSMRGFYLDEK